MTALASPAASATEAGNVDLIAVIERAQADLDSSRFARISTEMCDIIKAALRTSAPDLAAVGELNEWREQFSIFATDYNHYVDGKPDMPFNLLRTSLGIFLESCEALAAASPAKQPAGEFAASATEAGK